MANNITAAVGRSKSVLASAARTATPDTEELELPAGTRFVTLVIDVTAVTSTPSTTVTIAGVDRTSGKLFTIGTSAALAGTGTVTLKVGPGLTAAGTTVYNDMVPPVIRITSTHGNANSMTYSVGAHFV